MTAKTRRDLGKLWKQKKACGNFEQYYLEFKEQIDKELVIPVKSKVVKTKVVKNGTNNN